MKDSCFDETFRDENIILETPLWHVSAAEADFWIFYQFLDTVACINLQKNQGIVTHKFLKNSKIDLGS